MAGPTRKKPHGGKGDWTRPCDKEKFEENFDAIFGKKPLPNEAHLTRMDRARKRLAEIKARQPALPSRSENYDRAMQRSAEIKAEAAFEAWWADPVNRSPFIPYGPSRAAFMAAWNIRGRL